MKKNITTFKDIVKKTNDSKNERNSSEKLKGWVYFNKNELNKKYEKENVNENVNVWKKPKKKKEETTKEILDFYNKLSNRWNNYRDEINELVGDMSPFINYKNDIEKIVEEENMILEEIYNETTNYSSSSDDDLF
tara:strand:- start:657 stop:1061 length:405 start_codon:yes stop_codon:yes gene_type:complete